MNWVTLFLVLSFGLFQHSFWISKGNYHDMLLLEKQVLSHQDENQRLVLRNTAFAAEIKDLEVGVEAMEERARVELGYIKAGETFYRMVKH